MITHPTGDDLPIRSSRIDILPNNRPRQRGHDRARYQAHCGGGAHLVRSGEYEAHEDGRLTKPKTGRWGSRNRMAICNTIHSIVI